jgi:two-component system, OmpR family, response regulator
MSRLIALVEDDRAIRENYNDAMRRQGYETIGYSNRQEAMQKFKNRLPDMVIIDIGLGEEAEGGYDLCRELRAMSPTLPIIFLTARDSDFDAISGLRLGADDYLTKDITMPQLLARIAALFRRVNAFRNPVDQGSLIKQGKLMLDKNRMLAEWNGNRIELTLTEFWIVHSLAHVPGYVKSREQLMQEAEMYVDEGTITSHIKRIRKKFLALDSDFNCIETVYGMGYRWDSA